MTKAQHRARRLWALTKIRTGDDPVLRRVADPIVSLTELDFVEDMQDVCRALNGVGLAAPQIGISKRVIYVKGVGIMCNPVLEFGKGNETKAEGCLSFPGVAIFKSRFTKIAVAYTSVTGMLVTTELQDLKARVFQHELDHLNGINIV